MKIIGSMVVIITIGVVFAWIHAKETASQPTESATISMENIKIVSVLPVHTQDKIMYTVSASGTVRPKPYTRVASLVPGTVVFIAPVGAHIVQGQPLYQLTDRNIESGYTNALQSYNQTQSVTEERVHQAKLNLDAAKSRQFLAEENYKLAEKQAEQALESAQDSAQISYTTTYANLQQILTSLSDGKISAYNYLYRAIATTQSSQLTNAADQFIVAADLFLNLPRSANSAQLLPDYLDKELQAVLATKSLLETTSYILQNAVAGDQLNFLSPMELANARAMITNYQALINQDAASILNQQHGLDIVVTGNDLALSQSRNQKKLASIDVDNARTALISAQKSADLERTGAQAQLDSAQYAFDNLRLTAPFSGTVLSNLVDIGDQVRGGSEMLELGNINVVEIPIQVAASLLPDIRVGTSVTINKTILGEVNELAPTANVTSGKIAVTVISRDTKGMLSVGSIANVRLKLTRTGTNLIAIPLKAVTIEETGKSVLIMQGGKAIKKTVVLGEVLGDLVLVTKGLSVGDVVILRNGIFISEGDVVEAQSPN